MIHLILATHTICFPAIETRLQEARARGACFTCASTSAALLLALVFGSAGARCANPCSSRSGSRRRAPAALSGARWSPPATISGSIYYNRGRDDRSHQDRVRPRLCRHLHGRPLYQSRVRRLRPSRTDMDIDAPRDRGSGLIFPARRRGDQRQGRARDYFWHAGRLADPGADSRSVEAAAFLLCVQSKPQRLTGAALGGDQASSTASASDSARR